MLNPVRSAEQIEHMGLPHISSTLSCFRWRHIAANSVKDASEADGLFGNCLNIPNMDLDEARIVFG
jgi:hypothetical protein